jgi:hypothetical protein
VPKCVGARLSVLVPGWFECGGTMLYGMVLWKGKYG